jgi:hypothetical protein
MHRMGIRWRSIFLNNLLLVSSLSSNVCPSYPSNAFIAASASCECLSIWSSMCFTISGGGASTTGSFSPYGGFVISLPVAIVTFNVPATGAYVA